jgi:hypothetical protein
MKKYLLTTILAIAVLSLAAQSKGETEPYSVKRFGNTKITEVFSETSGGSITVIGEEAAEPRVEMYASRNNWRRAVNKEEVKQKLESDYEVTVSASNGKITATARRVKNTNDWENNLNISFKIFVPKNIATDLHTSGGNISLSNLTGNQEFKTSGGNLSVTKMAGNVKGRTSGGNIYLKDSKDNLDLTTSGGSIYAENCDGKITITTSGGNLDLSELKGDIRANTSGGNVRGERISGDLSTHTSGGNIRLSGISASVDASTSAGNIDLSATSLSKKITLSNSSGSIYLELPKTAGMTLRLSADNIRSSTLPNFKGRQEKEIVDGILNNGGIPVRASSSSGTIHLSLQ